MNVSIVVTQYEAGGAQKAAVNLANGLVEHGYTVNLVFLYKKSNAHFSISSEVNVCFVQRCVGTAKKLFLTLPKLYFLLKNTETNIVISFTHYANVYSAVAGKFVKAKVLVSHRNPLYSYSRTISTIDKALAHLGFYTAITYVSNSTKSTFKNNYSGKIKEYVVYNCAEKAVESPQGISQLPDRFIISVGRLTRQKNQELLIKAFSFSAYGGSLVIIGEGECEERLKKVAFEYGVSDRVLFFGGKPNNEVISIIKKSDALFMPSIYEGMSNVLLEAVANNVYTVVSDVPSQREVVASASGIYGEVISLDDFSGWVSSISKFEEGGGAPDLEVSAELIQRYSFSRFTDRFISIINDIY